MLKMPVKSELSYDQSFRNGSAFSLVYNDFYSKKIHCEIFTKNSITHLRINIFAPNFKCIISDDYRNFLRFQIHENRIFEKLIIFKYY